jgi:hypothetical protein
MFYYPNFDVMACVADGMPPYYFTSIYLSASAEECCAIYFPGVVAECIITSSLGGTDNIGGSYVLAINQQTGGSSSTVGSSTGNGFGSAAGGTIGTQISGSSWN